MKNIKYIIQLKAIMYYVQEIINNEQLTLTLQQQPDLLVWSNILQWTYLQDAAH